MISKYVSDAHNDVLLTLLCCRLSELKGHHYSSQDNCNDTVISGQDPPAGNGEEITRAR